MNGTQKYQQQLDAVILRLEALLQKCRCESLSGLASVALNNAESLMEILMEARWEALTARTDKASHPDLEEISLLPGSAGPESDPVEYCFPV